MTLVINEICHDEQNHFDQLPDELFAHVLQYFNFKTRVKCSQVCRRWHQIFRCQRTNFALPDVAVFNIFESDVWDCKLAKSAKSKLNSFFLKNVGNLREIASQIGACSSVKIWFQSEKFVEKILAVLSEKCFKFHCLDLYPFDTHLPLRKVFVYYPDLHALTLKPHGAEYFWNGMPLGYFPEDSRKLESLIIDSINTAENIVLPSTLTYLEWTHRDDTKFLFFVNKLYNCPKLNYLSISHVSMHELSQRILFEFFEHLPQLMYLTFKFVRFTKPLTGPPNVGEFDSSKNDDHDVPLMTNQKSIDNSNNASPDEKFVGLKVLKFDLCYGDINWAFKQICNFYRNRRCREENSSKNDLQIFSINTIWEEKQLKDVYSMVPVLAEANIWLQLGILQRQPVKKTNPQATRDEQNGSNRINGDANAAEVALIDADAARSSANALNETFPELPTKFNRVLCKLEMSFVESASFLSSIFYCGSIYERLLEIKFVQCSALRDCHFAWLAGSCPRLRKLQLTDCSSVQNEVICLEEFLRQWTSRKSKCLQIIWRLCLFRDLNALMEKLIAGKMCRPHAENVVNVGDDGSTLSIKLNTKIWPDQCADPNFTNSENKRNQRLTIYDSQGKMLTVQDYSPNELSTIFGAVIPTPVDDQDSPIDDQYLSSLVSGVNNL